MENVVLNGLTDINRKMIENCYEFRLQENSRNSEICINKDLCDDSFISNYSNHKQRIDAMFDDGKSIISDLSRGDISRKLVINKQHIDHKTKNGNLIPYNIQDKIEEMFEEISLRTSPNFTFIANESSQKEHFKPPLFPEKNIVKEYFKVTYIGSRPLKNKDINLASLQDPLKELYFLYKKKPTEFNSRILTICEEGLTIKTLGKEELNPFSTIAVWASVKLVFRTESGALEYAFLPLIADPDSTDKNLLFKYINSEDRNLISPNFLDDNQLPIFAIVMKNLNLSKQLECHGFICKSSEDAIVIAANLYHALIKKLKSKKKHQGEKIKKSNDKIEVSNTEEQKVSEIKQMIRMKKPAPSAPAKPPRRFYQIDRKHKIPTSSSETFDALSHHPSQSNEIVANLRNFSQRRGSVPDTMHGSRTSVARTLRRAVSDCGGSGVINKNLCEGDILTKVAIPRSQSFLNTNGPLLRFSGKNKTHAKNEILSPLGFNELFNEFRLHEGLESMDDILSVIIDAEGMSFNDLKPIYKDFLLKLAVILTKDELYNRSKAIMKRQKKKNTNCNFRKELFVSSIGLKKMFNKSSKTKQTKSVKSANLEFTSVIFQSSAKHWVSKSRNINAGRLKYFKVKTKPKRRRKLPKKVTAKFLSTISEDNHVMIRPTKNTKRARWRPNMSSSGYFSYGECNYDSENCTFTSTDKCYCTLNKIKTDVPIYFDSPAKNKSTCIDVQLKMNQKQDDSLKTCSCDTASCADSGKCYCMRREIRKFYNKLFRLSDIKGTSQTSHFPKSPGYLPKSSKKSEISILNQLKKGRLGLSLSGATIIAKNWQNNENNSDQERYTLTNRKTGLLRIHPLRLIPENLLQSMCYSKLENCHFKEFQNPLQKTETQNFGKRVYTYSNEDHIGGVFRKSNTYSTLKSICGNRQYSTMRYRNGFLGDLTISKPLHRSMSYRTKRFFGSVRLKRNCDDIMNHIKFPSVPSYSNSSLRFRRRMDVYNSFTENVLFNCQGNTINDSRQKISITPKLGHNPSRAHDPHEGFDNWENSRTSEKEVLTTLKHEDLIKDSPLNVSRKKMLVVSARDPKGKVLHMSASNNKCNSVKNSIIFIGSNTTGNASEALAVKKSAEIASLFSDSLIKQKPSRVEYASDEKENNYQSRSKSYDLEHGLGEMMKLKI